MSTFMGKYLPLLVRVSLGVVFVYAGVVKIGDPVAFAGRIAAYQILPYFWNYLLAATLPWLEVVCGLLLIAGWRVRAAALLLALLNLIFMAAIASTVVRGLDIDCGCFREGGKTSAWTALFRDTLFLAAAVYTFRKAKE